MQTINGWVVWDAEAWRAEYNDIYPSKELALKAASKHYSYIGDEITDSCIIQVSIRIH